MEYIREGQSNRLPATEANNAAEAGGKGWCTGWGGLGRRGTRGRTGCWEGRLGDKELWEGARRGSKPIRGGEGVEGTHPGGLGVRPLPCPPGAEQGDPQGEVLPQLGQGSAGNS